MADPKVETWLNTSLGTKWYKCFDVQGRETTKVVRGGHTFVLSTLERQMNQETALPHQDLFRNGTFVLKRGSDETRREEIDSPNSLTDAELEQIHREVTFGEGKIEAYLVAMDSLTTLQRLREVFAADGDSKKTDMDAIKARMQELNPGAAVNEGVVITRPEADPKPIKVSPGGTNLPRPTRVGG